MQPKIGIIGGTGLGDALFGREQGRRIEVDTPFGRPSSALAQADWNGVEVVFLNRHGEGHVHNPSSVPYRANIFAMKKMGVTTILASGATGSLRDEIEPGHLVICDQVIDKTHRRANTFFDSGLAVHVEMAEPFCERVRKVLMEVSAGMRTVVHHSGTYVCMEGPQFSTWAESNMHRGWGGDLIGMTVMPEARLAREAQMCYALIALPTDYDCWRRSKPAADKGGLLKEIIANLNRAGEAAIELIKAAIPALASHPPCPCHQALELAIWSDKSKVDPEVVKRLDLLIGRYFA
ncbi:MAG: S-methyl-5'-thioadenosine phosphorylase [Phycisphaerae bacterium]|nr:S-methyl-5'-thioadenosine phosphorylase [Phycisphaerae bacterium]